MTPSWLEFLTLADVVLSIATYGYMVSILRSKGIQVPVFSMGLVNLLDFAHTIRDETNPVLKRRYRAIALLLAVLLVGLLVEFVAWVRIDRQSLIQSGRK